MVRKPVYKDVGWHAKKEVNEVDYGAEVKINMHKSSIFKHLFSHFNLSSSINT